MSESEYVDATRSVKQCLGYLIEECGETMAAAGKSIRWGLDSFNPELGSDSERNYQWLLREMADLEVAIGKLRSSMPKRMAATRGVRGGN